MDPAQDDKPNRTSGDPSNPQSPQSQCPTSTSQTPDLQCQSPSAPLLEDVRQTDSPLNEELNSSPKSKGVAILPSPSVTNGLGADKPNSPCEIIRSDIVVASTNETVTSATDPAVASATDVVMTPAPCDKVTSVTESTPTQQLTSVNDESITSAADDTMTSATDDAITSATDDATTSALDEPSEKRPREMVSFRVVYMKKPLEITFDLDDTVHNLKTHITELTNVPPQMQKLMFKGLMRDEESLRQCRIMGGSRIMLVGSTINDVISVNSKPDSKELNAPSTSVATREPLCQQTAHRKVLDKHPLPPDCPPGITGVHELLPHVPLSGMINKTGGKVRLTFKLELDQLWIGTKERTQKINMSSISNVVSESIEGLERYHILGIQLGPTEASRYWIYYVPAQYVNAIRATIMG